MYGYIEKNKLTMFLLYLADMKYGRSDIWTIRMYIFSKNSQVER